MGSACPNNQVTRFYCDECGREEDLYEFEGGEYCEDCIASKLTFIEEEYAVCEDCNELFELYEFEDEILCLNCILDRLNKVE